MKKAYWGLGLALLMMLLGSCQLGRECREGFCRVDDEPNLWVYERALMAEQDANFRSVEVFDDRLVFTGKGPAGDFDYRVGDVLISSPYREPAFVRKVLGLEQRGDTLIVWTMNAGVADLLRGRLQRKISLREGLDRPIITDGRGRVLQVPQYDFSGRRQPLSINVDLPNGFFASGGIDYESSTKSVVFSDFKIGKKVTVDEPVVKGGACNDPTHCKPGFTCVGDDNTADGRMDGDCQKSSVGESAEFGAVFSGRLTPSIEADLDYEIGWHFVVPYVKKFKVAFGGGLNLDFQKLGVFAAYKNSISFDVQLGPPLRTSTPIPIGPIVIPAGIRLALFTGCEASVEIAGEIAAPVQVSSSFTLGAEYSDGDWRELNSANFSASAQPPAICINGGVNWSVFLKPELMFEFVVGSGIGPAVYLAPGFSADIKFLPQRCLEFFFQVPAGFEMNKDAIDHWCGTAGGLTGKICSAISKVFESLSFSYDLYKKSLYKDCAKQVCKKDYGGGTEDVYWLDEKNNQLVPEALCGLVTHCDKEMPMGTKVCCGGECVEFCGKGNLEGLVVDKDDETKKIAGAQVKLTDSDGNVVFQGATGADGLYRVNDLDAGWYRLEITAQGYYPYEADVQIRSQETQYVAKLEAIPAACDADGTISGIVTDASTGAPVAGAKLLFKKMSDGVQVDNTTTDQNGHYQSKPLPLGYYLIEVTAEGYARTEVENVSVCGYDDGNPDNDDTVENITIAPAEGNWHVVLQWGSSPQDLDLHAKLPSGEHIFYRAGCRGDRNAAPYAGLDVDVREGYGPETVTITQPQTGTYQFFVHNYGGQNDENDSGSLSGSGARLVLVNPAGETVRTFNVPGSCSAYFWYAFNLRFDGNGEPTVEPTNNCGGGSNPADYEDPPICDLP